MAKVLISVINYRTQELTERCLESIQNKKWKNDFEIKVVDNNSGDGSLEYLKKKFSKIDFIKSPKNLGFAGGHNLVLKDVKADYVLILNSDTEVLANTLDKMVEFMEGNVQIGIASCKVLGFDGKLQPNGGDLPIGRALINWLFNLESFGFKEPSFHREDIDYYEKPREVGWVSGNFMMLRKEVLEKVGGMNDEYFMYFEDVEYCYKTKKAGFEIWINPEVQIKHLSGGSLDNPRFRQWLGEYKGLIYFYFKEFGELPGYLVKSAVLITTLLRILAFSLIGKMEFAKTYADVIRSL